jgi:hypothetical protein
MDSQGSTSRISKTPREPSRLCSETDECLSSESGIAKLSEFEQKLGQTQIYHSFIVQHSGYWPEVENQLNLTYVDNTMEKGTSQKVGRGKRD